MGDPLQVNEKRLTVDVVGIKDADGTTINPATEEKQLPDGHNVTVLDTQLFSETTPLGAGVPVVKGAYNTEGVKEVEFYISTDAVTAADGIVVEFTPNPDDVTPVYSPGPKFTFTAEEVATGYAIKRFVPARKGFRVTYTNDGVGQSFFVFEGIAYGVATGNPNLAVRDNISSSQQSLATRSILYAEDEDVPDSFPNINQKNGGLKTSTANHEVRTPLAIPSALTGGANPSVSAVSPVQVASTPPTGTATIYFQADPNNGNKSIYLGYSAGVSAATAPVVLNAGNDIAFRIQPGQVFYAIASATGARLGWTYSVEIL